LDIRFLESLIAVINTGSIASAARSQNLTSAAVSQRVRTLETQLNTTLLTRDAHSAKPTQICLNLEPHIRALIQDSYSLLSMTDTSGLSGNLKLGAISTALTDFIPDILAELRKTAPNATFTIIPGSSSSLYEQLLSKELDGAITVNPDFTLPKQILLTPLLKQRVVLLSKKACKSSIQKTIQDNPLILYDKQSWGGNLIAKWLQKLDVSYRVFCELDSLETIALLVEEGMGIAIVPEWKGLYQYHPKLTIQAIKNAPQREIVLLSQKVSSVSALLKLVISSQERRCQI